MAVPYQELPIHQKYGLAIDVLGTAFFSCTIAVLILSLRDRFKFERPCLIGFGVCPFVIYAAMILINPPLFYMSLWKNIFLMTLFFAPNYLLCLVVAILFKQNIFKATERISCSIFLLLHFNGLSWFLALSAYS